MSARLDLLLINPGSRTEIYQGLGQDLAAIEPPVWAGLAATFVRRIGFSVAILDANAEGLSPAAVAGHVSELQPRLVAIAVYGHNPSASTQVMPSAGAICSAIRRSAGAPRVLLFGGHVAALPERTLEEEEVDFVSTGEGVYTIADLVAVLRNGGDPRQVPGLAWVEDGAVRRTPSPRLVHDLDEEMPGIAWDLLPMHRYRAHNWHCFGEHLRSPYASLYTSLGCPYRCSYCCIQAPFKTGEQASGLQEQVNSYRLWSAERVVDEIGLLVERYGVRHIKIADEMFVLNPRHVREITDRLIERRYPINVWAYARVDTVTHDMPDRLKRAGINWLCFGIESGSTRVRDDVHKRFEQEVIRETVRRVREAGIHVIANYIFGLPEDTLGTMQQTLDLAMELNCEFANFYTAMAYPGSELYQSAIAAGWALPTQWSAYSQHAADTLPLPTHHVSAREVLRFRDEAFHAYFTNPSYLRMVGDTFGTATVHEIQRMTAHTLTRDALAGVEPRAPAQST